MKDNILKILLEVREGLNQKDLKLTQCKTQFKNQNGQT